MTGIFAGFVSFSSDPLSLKQMEEALRNSIIIAVPTPAHAGVQIMVGKKLSPLLARKL